MVHMGQCKQTDIIRVFGVSAPSVKRSVKKYRKEGPSGFYKPRKGHQGTVLTDKIRTNAQHLLNLGHSRAEVAREMKIKPDTLRKAIRQGRLAELNGQAQPVASNKSERSVEDAKPSLGTACTRIEERVLASFGMLESAPARFEPCRDVTYGGVLCALPALFANGLFKHLDQCFVEFRGYYMVLHVIVLLVYMALCRIKTVEQLQYHPPGEMGKLLGLDRVPEVRCLRGKLKALSQGEAPGKWAALLNEDWMKADPESGGFCT